MKIYTSYFGKIKDLEKNNIYPIAICCIPPKIDIPNLASVAPTKNILFECKGNEKEYTKRFTKEILETVLQNPEVFVEHLEKMSGGKDVALCCYEKPEDFCHRHLIADWINKKLGLNIEEYGQKYNKP